MSHTVTVTRTTTTTSTSAIIINTGYCKTKVGLLKILQVVIGAVIVGLLTYHLDKPRLPLFFYCIAVTFFIGSFLLLVGCLISISTGSIIAKTSYDFVYHGGAFILYCIVTILFFNEQHNRDYPDNNLTICAILGIVQTVLYFLSAYFAYKSYRIP